MIPKAIQSHSIRTILKFRFWSSEPKLACVVCKPKNFKQTFKQNFKMARKIKNFDGVLY